MIKIKNLNKYYNKNTSNELHALKNINIELPNTGLVAILGKSGCGKSSLINCMTGIEPFDTGDVTYDSKICNTSAKINKFKAKNMATVFQDYNLVENMTVEENIQLALEVAGQEGHKQKVDIALDVVKMSRYNKRKINTLSGGQQQRVAIARALAISPKIIFADEPTGNLDKCNAINVFNILKAISKNILVVVVSHDVKLVNMYAERIITMSDGKIIDDVVNDLKNEKPFELENVVYLEDYEMSVVTIGNSLVKIFHKGEADDFSIVLDGGSCIFDGEKTINIKHMPLIEKREKVVVDFSDTDEKDVVDFSDTDEKDVGDFSRKLKNIVEVKTSKKVKLNFAMSKLKKVAICGLILCSMVVAISMSLFGRSIKVDDILFRYSPDNSISIYTTFVSKESLQKIVDSDYVEFVSPFEEVAPEFNLIQTSCLEAIKQQGFNPHKVGFNAKPLPIKFISESNIIHGKMPTSNLEIVVDKMVIDKLQKVSSSGNGGVGSMFGMLTYQSYLNCELLYCDNMKITVVGICDSKVPTIFMHQDLIYTMSISKRLANNMKLATENIASFTNYDTSQINDNEAVISKQEFLSRGFAVGADNKLLINQKAFVVKRYYTPVDKTDGASIVILKSSALESLVLDYMVENQGRSVDIVVNNVDKAMEDLTHRHSVFPESTYYKELNSYLYDVKGNMVLNFFLTMLVILTALVLCAISYKASLIEKEREMAVKLSLGETKNKMF